MVFFPEKPRDEQTHIWAVTLRDAIKKVARCNPTLVHLRQWDGCFARLRKEHGAELVEKVLIWYVSHIGEEFVPVANNGVVFKAKFEQIKRAMETCDEPSEAHPMCKRTADRLSQEYQYPVEILAQLPKLIEKTGQNWVRFCETILLMPESDVSAREFIFLHEKVIGQYIFTENWMILLSKKYGYLQHYTGIVQVLAFSPDLVLFRNSFWREWAGEWTSDPCTFDSLLLKVLEHWRKKK